MGFYLVFTYTFCFLLVFLSPLDNNRISSVQLRGSTKSYYTSQSLSLKTTIPSAIWFALILVLIIILGMRGVATGDYYAYSDLFLSVNSGYTIVHPEKSNYLFDWLCRIVFLLGGSFNLVFLVSACITIVFFSKGLQYTCTNRFLFLALFLLSFQYYDLFNIVRQGIVDSIGFYVLCRVLYGSSIGVKKRVFFFLLLCFCSLVHTTGIFFVLLFLIICFRKKEVPLLFEIALLVLVSVISSFLASNESFSNMLTIVFGATWRAGKYNVEMELGAREIGEGIVGIVIWILYRFKSNTREQKWLGFLTWAFVTTRFMTTNIRIMYRIADCLVPFYLLALLDLPSLFTDRIVKILIRCFSFLFYVIFFYFKVKGYTSFHGYFMINPAELFMAV